MLSACSVQPEGHLRLRTADNSEYCDLITVAQQVRCGATAHGFAKRRLGHIGIDVSAAGKRFIGQRESQQVVVI